LASTPRVSSSAANDKVVPFKQQTAHETSSAVAAGPPWSQTSDMERSYQCVHSWHSAVERFLTLLPPPDELTQIRQHTAAHIAVVHVGELLGCELSVRFRKVEFAFSVRDFADDDIQPAFVAPLDLAWPPGCQNEVRAVSPGLMCGRDLECARGGRTRLHRRRLRCPHRLPS
jgi:hypothetical protein